MRSGASQSRCLSGSLLFPSRMSEDRPATMDRQAAADCGGDVSGTTAGTRRSILHIERRLTLFIRQLGAGFGNLGAQLA